MTYLDNQKLSLKPARFNAARFSASRFGFTPPDVDTKTAGAGGAETFYVHAKQEDVASTASHTVVEE